MAWNLPTSMTTRTLPSVSQELKSKHDLKMGDMLLDKGDHALLFLSWTSSAKTSYNALEMTTKGAREYRINGYPYWGNDNSYKPYRYKHIRD